MSLAYTNPPLPPTKVVIAPGTGRCVDLADHVVAAVGDEEVPRAVHHEALRETINWAAVAGPPSPPSPEPPLPANVVIVLAGSGSTSRITLLPESAMTRSPRAGHHDADGVVQLGGCGDAVALAVSRLCQSPATVVIMPVLVELTSRITVVAAVGDEEVRPCASIAMPFGAVQLGCGGRAAIAAVAAEAVVVLARVVMMVPSLRSRWSLASTSRITLLPESAMKRSPSRPARCRWDRSARRRRRGRHRLCSPRSRR